MRNAGYKSTVDALQQGSEGLPLGSEIVDLPLLFRSAFYGCEGVRNEHRYQDCFEGFSLHRPVHYQVGVGPCRMHIVRASTYEEYERGMKPMMTQYSGPSAYVWKSIGIDRWISMS